MYKERNQFNRLTHLLHDITTQLHKKKNILFVGLFNGKNIVQNQRQKLLKPLKASERLALKTN